MPANVVLYGPPGAGKTTFGRKLEAESGTELLSIDQLRPQLAKSAGYSTARAEHIYDTHGATAYAIYVARFDELILNRLLRKNRRSVIDTAGGHVMSQEDESSMVGNFSILMLPSDRKAWREALANRPEATQWSERGGDKLNEYLYGQCSRLVPMVDLVVDWSSSQQAHDALLQASDYLTEVC